MWLHIIFTLYVLISNACLKIVFNHSYPDSVNNEFHFTEILIAYLLSKFYKKCAYNRTKKYCVWIETTDKNIEYDF